MVRPNRWQEARRRERRCRSVGRPHAQATEGSPTAGCRAAQQDVPRREVETLLPGPKRFGNDAAAQVPKTERCRHDRSALHLAGREGSQGLHAGKPAGPRGQQDAHQAASIGVLQPEFVAQFVGDDA